MFSLWFEALWKEFFSHNALYCKKWQLYDITIQMEYCFRGIMCGKTLNWKNSKYRMLTTLSSHTASQVNGDKNVGKQRQVKWLDNYFTVHQVRQHSWQRKTSHWGNQLSHSEGSVFKRDSPQMCCDSLSPLGALWRVKLVQLLLMFTFHTTLQAINIHSYANCSTLM